MELNRTAPETVFNPKISKLNLSLFKKKKPILNSPFQLLTV